MNFPPRLFPGFLGPEALKLSVTPARQAELVCFSQLRKIAYCGSRGIIPLVGVWGEQPQRIFCLIGISSLRTRLLAVKNRSPRWEERLSIERPRPACMDNCFLLIFQNLSI